MKTSKAGLWLAVLLLTAVSVRGQTRDDNPDLVALRTLKAIYEKAVSSDDLALLGPRLEPEFTGVMVTGHEVRGFDGLKDYWAKMKELMGKGARYEVKVTADLTTFLGDLALSRGTADEFAHAFGKEFRYQSRWTAMARKQPDGSWKLLRVHASMDPVENVFVAEMRRVTRLSFGLGGLALGAAGALIWCYVRGRKQKPAGANGDAGRQTPS